MQKVISINLNGNAFQLDETGYETLQQYLARAARQLESNPDRAEIVADLEQAIADKCQGYLGPHKNVVTAAEIEKVVAEMGPVESEAEGAQSAPGEQPGESASSAGSEAIPRRLFRVQTSDGAGAQRGAMIGGVCAGLATYFGIDVTIVRIAFVIAAFLTKGVAIVAYIIMMFVVPEATTAEQRAAAAGAPFNAKEVVDRARRRSADAGRELRRHWRRQQRAWRRGWPAGAPYAYGPPPAALALLPVFGIAHMAFFLVAISMLVSLVNTRAILSWRLPEDVPLWAAALALLIAYQVAVAPLRAVRQWAVPAGPGVAASMAFWNAVVWLTGLAFAIWLAANHVPEIREFVQHVPQLFRDFVLAMRDLFQSLRAE